LTNHWTSYIEQQCQLPNTVEEAVNYLLLILPDDIKTAIANLDDLSLIDLHFTLGQAIRNGFKLHQQDSVLSLESGASNADDASHIIIKQLWKRLNEI